MRIICLVLLLSSLISLKINSQNKGFTLNTIYTYSDHKALLPSHILPLSSAHSYTFSGTTNHHLGILYRQYRTKTFNDFMLAGGYSNKLVEFRSGPTGSEAKLDHRLSIMSFNGRIAKGFYSSLTNLDFVQFGLAFGVDPIYSFSSTAPIEQTVFPTNSHTLNIAGLIIPQINIKISKKWNVGFQIPVELANFSFEWHKDKNPALPDSRNSLTRRESRYLKLKSSVNISVGYRF